MSHPADTPADVRLRAAIDSAPSGLLMVDGNGRIVLVNRELERLSGYTRVDLIGRPVEMLVPERYRAAHRGFRAGFVAAPEARFMGAGRELFALRSDGVEVPVEIGLTPIETPEGPFVVSSVVDITTRKRAEQERVQLEAQLRQAQKMEALGTLAGGIAHDFNNVLAAIVGYGELVHLALPPGSPAADDLAEVLRAADRGRQLVQRILQFSRRQPVERRPVDLVGLTREVVAMLRATLPSTIEVRTIAPPALPPVIADPAALHQALMNLAANAFQAMPGGGVLQIALETRYLRDSAVRSRPGLREGDYVALIVRDDGHGIEQDVLPHVFEPFFSTKPPGQGTGLGLAMVHSIVRDHAGAVDIESEPGRGTTVTCLLPVADAAADPTVPGQEATPAGTGQRILYVDDEPALAASGGRRLEHLGYAVVTATSPADAVELVRAQPAAFDLVITDYTMPGFDGLELARRLTALRPDLPVLLLTGFIEELPASVLEAAGIRRLIPKPASLGQLAEATAAVLSGHRP